MTSRRAIHPWGARARAATELSIHTSGSSLRNTSYGSGDGHANRAASAR
jgi:hypothetical protein